MKCMRRRNLAHASWLQPEFQGLAYADLPLIPHTLPLWDIMNSDSSEVLRNPLPLLEGASGLHLVNTLPSLDLGPWIVTLVYTHFLKYS